MSRGRGRGQLSFNAELLGIGRGDVPSSVVIPPPTFPSRLAKPRPLLASAEQQDIVAIGDELASSFRNSSFFIKAIAGDKIQKDLELDWNKFPTELKPEYRKRMLRKKKNKARKSQVDMTKKLELLEKQEGQDGDKSGDDEAKKDSDDSDDETKDKENAEESDGEEEKDEEMDEGTDYANNYFDNGDGYLDDEDDNLDEGGVYH